MTRYLLLATLLALLLSAAAALAQDVAATTDQEPKPPEMILKTYYVSDIIHVIPDFGETVPRTNLQDMLSCTGYGGGGGSGALFAPVTTVETTISGTERLKELIERVVRPEAAWESAGGTSTLEFYDRVGLMAVNTTAQAHAQIEKLLADLRAQTVALQVDVQAVELDPAFAADTFAKGRTQFWTPEDQQALRKAVTRTLGLASLSLFNGQRVWRSTGTHIAYVSDVTPIVVAPESPAPPAPGATPPAESVKTDTAPQQAPPQPCPGTAYDPVISWLVDGLIVDVKPTLSADRATVTMDYRLECSRVLNAQHLDADNAKPIVGPGLPRVLGDASMGTALLPVNCPTLLSSGSAQTASEPDKKDPAFQVHYIVTVRLATPQGGPPAKK